MSSSERIVIARTPLAPLASMEDISQVNTPLPTPGPSPRTKHRLSQRSSLGIILDVEEETDFDKFETLPEVDGDKCERTNENNKSLQTTKDSEAVQLLPWTEYMRPKSTTPRGVGRKQYHGVTFSQPLLPSSCAETQFLTPRRKHLQRRENHPTQPGHYQIRFRNKVEDRSNLVFLNFLFQGFSIALPFNLIMVSDILFKYLLVDNEASSPSSLWIWSLPNVLLTSFSLQLLIALPTSFFPVRWFSARVSVSILGLVICTVMLIISILTGTTNMFILPTSILLSMFTGLYLTSCSGMLSRLPSRYSGSLYLGMSLQQLWTVDPKLLSIYYLIFVLAAYLASFDLHYALPVTDFYQQYTHTCHHKQDNKQNCCRSSQPWLAILLFISTAISFTIFPSIFKDIRPMTTLPADKLTLLVCYLNFYVSSSLGILSAIFSYLPVTWLASLLTVIRLLLVFVFLVSNYLPESRAMTVVIHWDWTLAITVTVFSLLGGFISHHLRARLLRAATSETSRSREAMKAVLISIFGAICGLSLSSLLPLVVTIQI